MTRRVSWTAGAVLLAGLGGWPLAAFAQGTMTPRPVDVAPRGAPTAVAPPVVAPPVVAPPPMAPPMAPAMAPPMAPTAPVPATGPTSRGPVGVAPARSGALSDGIMILRDVGVTTSGPGGVMQVRSDGGGWTRFDKLPVGNTIIEFNGRDLASALKASGAPVTPTAQQNHIELLVVIAIIAIRTDGTPVVFTGSVPASAVKTIKADLRIGRDGNAMEANWGNGPQLPQVLPRTGVASLTVPGPNGPVPLSPALVKSLQDRAAGSAPGLVDANAAIGPAATTR